LSVGNNITVRAEWRGEAFTTLLRIGKVLDGQRGDKGDDGKQGSPAPHYRGKTYEPGDVIGWVNIKISPAAGDHWVKMEAGDWVAYLGNSAGIWVNGMCMRWNGVSWEAREIKADGNFETNPYVAALMDLTEGAPNGAFMAILVRDLIAKTAMIEQIQAQLIQVHGAIFGGERFVKYENTVVDLGTDKIGFKLGADGKLMASNAEISGKIKATEGEFRGTLDVVNINLKGIFSSGRQYVLRSDNHLVKFKAENGDGEIAIIKTIKTPAKGSCTIRLKFLEDIIAGYRIRVNNTPIMDWDWIFSGKESDGYVYINHVSLPNNYNTVDLELMTTIIFGTSLIVRNTTFELLVSTDPGLFRALG
jgi:hypothetical protein